MPYPTGVDMRGSGIFTEQFESTEWCDNCDSQHLVDVHVDDWGTGTWECPTCTHEHRVSMADRRSEARIDAAEDARDWVEFGC